MRPPPLLLLVLVLAAAPARASGPPAPAHALPFIADDYRRALAEARSRQLPLFIEAWAPW